MERRTPLETGEVYHVYNRGAHKQPIYIEDSDLTRFQVMLLLANTAEQVDVGNILIKYQGPSLVNLFSMESPTNRLVDILSYVLMPNHFHLVLRQAKDGGISRFMRKLCTGYSMYYNLRHDHSGTIFQGRYKSVHVDTDAYLTWLCTYVHLNSIALIEPEWKDRSVQDLEEAKTFLRAYVYSSYVDYYIGERPESLILDLRSSYFIDKKRDMYALLDDYAKGRTAYREI